MIEGGIFHKSNTIGNIFRKVYIYKDLNSV